MKYRGVSMDVIRRKLLTPTLAGNFLRLAGKFGHSQETFCISQENFGTRRIFLAPRRKILVLAGIFLRLTGRFGHSQETSCITQENFWTTQASKRPLEGSILKISQEEFRYSELQNRYIIPEWTPWLWIPKAVNFHKFGQKMMIYVIMDMRTFRKIHTAHITSTNGILYRYLLRCWY